MVWRAGRALRRSKEEKVLSKVLIRDICKARYTQSLSNAHGSRKWIAQVIVFHVLEYEKNIKVFVVIGYGAEVSIESCSSVEGGSEKCGGHWWTGYSIVKDVSKCIIFTICGWWIYEDEKEVNKSSHCKSRSLMLIILLQERVLRPSHSFRIILENNCLQKLWTKTKRESMETICSETLFPLPLWMCRPWLFCGV